MDRGAWLATVHGVAKSRTRLSDFTSLSQCLMTGASLVAQMVKCLPAVWETWVSGRSSGEGNGNPLQYSCLENSMDGETW